VEDYNAFAMPHCYGQCL